jgi:hypothetical protein
MPLANPSSLVLKEHAEDAGLGQSLAATLVMSSLQSFRSQSQPLPAAQVAESRSARAGLPLSFARPPARSAP